MLNLRNFVETHCMKEGHNIVILAVITYASAL